VKGTDREKTKFTKKRVLMLSAEYGIMYMTGMKPLEAIPFAERENGVGKGEESSVNKEPHKIRVRYFLLTCHQTRKIFLNN
jgi:hypothetical protein